MSDTDFAELLIGQIPTLRRYARALLRERGAADDLVQDSLERAWSRAHLLRSPETIRVWLYTIMHNLFVSGIRDQRRAPPLVPLHESGYADANPATHDHALLGDELERALAALATDQRAALLLVGVEDLSYREAAEVLGIPEGTLMSRLHRGRRRLRILLEGVSSAPLKRVK